MKIANRKIRDWETPKMSFSICREKLDQILSSYFCRYALAQEVGLNTHSRIPVNA